MIVTDLIAIAQAAEKNEEENFHFREFLQTQDSDTIDKMVFALNESISNQIDCTQCGNCCRSMIVNTDKPDIERLANHFGITKETFEEKYVEKSGTETLAIINKIPCHFLHSNKCLVYEARPNDCREFPGLHRAGFTARLFAILRHYGRCPITYNVIEALKKEVNKMVNEK